MEPLRNDNKDEIWHLAQTLRHFRPLIPPDVSKRLAEARIIIEGHQITALITGLGVFEATQPELYTTKEMAASEQRIADLAEELSALIAASPFTQDGWRYVWGDVPADEEDPDPQDCVEVAGFLSQLKTIKDSAIESVDVINESLTSRLLPGSNRANRLRYFYWLLLLAYWKTILGRDFGLCNDEIRGPNGPLVSFMQALSAGGLSAGIFTEAELSGNAIQQFVRRNSNRVEGVAEFFSRW